ncbi:MAG: NAD(P)-dependent oxidoreductase [Cytophagales bacterium]|nr:NAD(P)-dependent oxidoreductase [Cytophagales bacterium]MDW8383323.1 NAD(P)-dependent oxidoreductase [Flammeovirgaceae bacterium]
MKIGILREEKIPVDRRVALVPQSCKQLLEQYAHLQIFVQPSDFRCFKDEEYQRVGAILTEDLSHCDILLGIKEVPIKNLIPEKTYLFFSHTIKKQPHNRKLLQAILAKKIRLIDWETLTTPNGERLIAFGRFAGIVGAYNALRGWGIRENSFFLKPAYQCKNLTEVWEQLQKVSLSSVKIVITGDGRVGKGAKETLEKLNIRQVTPKEFLSESFSEAVFTQLSMADYHFKTKNGSFEQQDFYKNPQEYSSSFLKYAKVADMLIACAFWDPRAPLLFTRQEMKRPDFRIRLIADITCDINGSIPSTMQATTIENPFYDYSPTQETIEKPFSSKDHITVMAIDNLPNELPIEASSTFSQTFCEKIFPCFGHDADSILERATICQEGKLTRRFSYLQDYVEKE